MKSLYIKTIAYSMLVLLFISCKKDEDRVVAGNGTAPVLTSTAASSMVLKEDNAAANAGVFSWTASSFGFEGSVVSYTLQVGVAGKNFSTVREVTVGSGLTTTVTVATLNSLVNQLGLAAGQDGKAEVRVKATISDTYTPAYSNVLTYTVNPYQIIIDYPSLWVPGAYQNWTPATASKISSVLDNRIYEGYINFAAPGEFKLNPAANWDHSYGTPNTNANPGIIILDGGVNLSVASAGYYLIQANTNALTWSATKTTFSVAGTAVGTETPMTLDVATGTWTITKTLAAGTLTFKANGANLTYGSEAVANGKLALVGTGLSGAAIPVTVAGTYKIIFNVSIPGNYVYSIIAQ
jgi:hypothetical protein